MFRTDAPRPLCQRRVERCPVEVVDQVTDRSLRPLPVILRQWSTKQIAQILDPTPRHHKKRLEEQVLQHCVVPNIDHDRQLWPDLRNVSVVLIGTNTKIDSTVQIHLLHPVENVLIRELIRDQVVRTKVARTL